MGFWLLYSLVCGLYCLICFLFGVYEFLTVYMCTLICSMVSFSLMCSLNLRGFCLVTFLQTNPVMV